MADKFYDQNGVVDFIDRNGHTLFKDRNNIFLGIGGIDTAVAIVADRVLDNGLSVLADEADRIYICSAEPTTHAEVLSLALGVKSFGAGGAFGPLAAGAPGRKVSSTSVTDGSVSVSGTGTYWATVNSSTSALLARGPVVTATAVTSGNQFSLPSFSVTMPGQ
jgi:hypothetical protein